MSLPYHLSENCFRVYEFIIAEIVKAYPKAIPVASNKLAGTTLSARLRDSIKSYRLHNWPSEAIDRERFLQCDIKVSHKPDGRIFAGSKEAIRQLDIEPLEVETPYLPEEESFTIQIENFYELQGLAKAAAAGAFKGPIKLQNITTEWAQKVQESFDVDLSMEGQYWVLL